MPIQKTEAIVLRRRKQGETSKILSVYTRQYGRMSVVAKGSRSIKSHYLGVLEPLNHIQLVFYRKDTRDIQYASQAEIIHHFPNIHAELGKMALASIICEIIEKTEERDHENTRLFLLILESFAALEKSSTGLLNIIRSFELKYLDLAGLKPNLNSCANCEKTAASPANTFSMEKGCYSCSDCGRLSESNVEISGRAIEFMRWFFKVPVADSTKALVGAAVGKEIDNFLMAFMRYHIDGLYDLLTYSYLEKLKVSLRNNEQQNDH